MFIVEQMMSAADPRPQSSSSVGVYGSRHFAMYDSSKNAMVNGNRPISSTGSAGTRKLVPLWEKGEWDRGFMPIDLDWSSGELHYNTVRWKQMAGGFPPYRVYMGGSLTKIIQWYFQRKKNLHYGRTRINEIFEKSLKSVCKGHNHARYQV